MKKTVLVISLLGTFGFASAQTSNVTVYGTLDAGVASVHGSDSAGTVTSVESGQQSYSRFGFKGSEDLGSGLKALFLLEEGIQINNGTSGLNTLGSNGPMEQNNSMFGSQAYIGLAGNFGSVKLGRQLTPLYEAYGSIDPFVNGFAANINNFFGTDAHNMSNYQRMSNAAVYETPDNLYGLKGSVAYGFGGVAGDTSAQSQVGVSLGYLNGPFTLSYAYHHANNEQSGVPGATSEAFKTNFVGAAYDFNVVKVHAAFDQNEQGSTFKTQDYLLGATVPFGAHAIFADYTHKNNKRIDRADANQYAVGYTYNLSKRTNFYAAYTYVKNQETSTIDTEVAGNSVGTVQAGIRHSF